MEHSSYHIPALLSESIDLLNINPKGIYVDATFGGGGHSHAILGRLAPKGRLFGFDRDIDALQNAPDDHRFTFVHSDYRFVPNFLTYYGVDKVDGILADLGVSFHHFDNASRGFSFREDAPLDMRMNQSGLRTAADLTANFSQKDFETLFRTFTDLKRPANVARAIIEYRERTPILTTAQLAEALTPAMNPKNLKKDLAQAFQAIRIEVNDELKSLEEFLKNSLSILNPGGRLAIITYHSIEDRLVKNFFRSGNPEGKIESDFYGNIQSPLLPVTRSPIVPDDREIEQNPRSRSAKLRVAEFKEDYNNG